MVLRILNHRADQNPITTNPSTTLLASKTITAFITRENKPNVKKVIGKVKNEKIGLINVLINPKTKATPTAVRKLDTATPSKIYADKNTAIELNSKFCNQRID